MTSSSQVGRTSEVLEALSDSVVIELFESEVLGQEVLRFRIGQQLRPLSANEKDDDGSDDDQEAERPGNQFPTHGSPPDGVCSPHGQCVDSVRLGLEVLFAIKIDTVAVTVYGVVALTFMMLMYTLERRGPVFVLGFAAGCVLSSAYGFLSGAWPFGVVELIWAGVALGRYRAAITAGPHSGYQGTH